jgi:ArsR family transcriptional regulator
MQSLADESRLRLLHLLSRHELGVSELADVLQMPQSTVSRHLKVLSDEGWTRSRRQGTNHLYRLLDSELDPAARKLWLLTRDQTAADTSIRQDEMRLARVLRARESESQSFFAGAAGEWDKLRSEMYGQAFSQSALLSLIPRHYIVADLGCGTGQLAEQLAPHVRQVIAVDNSPAMLKAARPTLGPTHRTSMCAAATWARSRLTRAPATRRCWSSCWRTWKIPPPR